MLIFRYPVNNMTWTDFDSALSVQHRGELDSSLSWSQELKLFAAEFVFWLRVVRKQNRLRFSLSRQRGIIIWEYPFAVNSYWRQWLFVFYPCYKLISWHCPFKEITCILVSFLSVCPCYSLKAKGHKFWSHKLLGNGNRNPLPFSPHSPFPSPHSPFPSPHTLKKKKFTLQVQLP